VLINSLREGLLACPLETLMEILPEGSSSVLGIGSQGELAEAIHHVQLQVSCMPTSHTHYFPLLTLFFLVGYNKDGCLVAKPPGSFQSQPSLMAKVTEMQSRIQELEFDVSRTEDLESQIEPLRLGTKI
jgi:hypothetical protein